MEVHLRLYEFTSTQPRRPKYSSRLDEIEITAKQILMDRYYTIKTFVFGHLVLNISHLIL